MDKSCAYCAIYSGGISTSAIEDASCPTCNFNKKVEKGNNQDRFEPTLSFIVEQIDEISEQINDITKNLEEE